MVANPNPFGQLNHQYFAASFLQLAGDNQVNNCWGELLYFQGNSWSENLMADILYEVATVIFSALVSINSIVALIGYGMYTIGR
ncbi:MAG: hypothetical protein ABI325_13250 [Ginsengibacter sp.]